MTPGVKSKSPSTKRRNTKHANSFLTRAGLLTWDLEKHHEKLEVEGKKEEEAGTTLDDHQWHHWLTWPQGISVWQGQHPGHVWWGYLLKQEWGRIFWVARATFLYLAFGHFIYPCPKRRSYNWTMGYMVIWLRIWHIWKCEGQVFAQFWYYTNWPFKCWSCPTQIFDEKYHLIFVKNLGDMEKMWRGVRDGGRFW